MSDKIANFEDYVKRDASNEHKEAEVKEEITAPTSDAAEKETAAPKADPVPQETMEIEIEDPYQFLNAEEREEYIKQRQKDMQEERRQESIRKAAERSERRPARQRQYEEYDEEYDEEYEDEEYQDEEESGINMNLVVRVGSILTGILILAILGMFLKVKVYDRYFAPDPDEATQTVITSIPAGFTEKNDTVEVSGAEILNVRSVPSSADSSTVIGMVPVGTELKRIAVSDDGSWALVEFEGEQAYASMKYLKVK
ncbi:SH3 domain-containing protein [Butyrivibrio sp. CB08]|uniref:SH3 domain-containing protein n=1 Tax=Butyrivibrio sp. CB08 TaxID=2364879 RepID=UPI000EA90098|nr:SH3 domain-containing protein [Butyrivibrio sp. CB08]RKM58825.1 SH3 domain-containing protein [Butyrivibrio sp. CB08]